jgi:cytidine deaminase
MKQITEQLQATMLEDDSTLTENEKALLVASHQAAENAYAPYSTFHVGAAVQLKNGKVVIGSNQENMAYPSGLCAERVALFSAGSMHPNEPIESMAVTVIAEGLGFDDVITPCGNCRQVIMEYQFKQNSPIKLLMAAQDGQILVVEDAKTLLPFAFRAEGLKK